MGIQVIDGETTESTLSTVTKKSLIKVYKCALCEFTANRQKDIVAHKVGVADFLQPTPP